MTDVSDLRSTIVPKSDQLNAEQLLGGPMTIRVTDVRIGTGNDQPIHVHYEGENGRPFKPCKTMRKVLILAWGPDGREWVGKSMTLYTDPKVKFGGEEVGGIRISHLSDIERAINVSLTETRGKKVLHRIERMQAPKGPALQDVLQAIRSASGRVAMQAAKALIAQMTDQADADAAGVAYNARAAELKRQAAGMADAQTQQQQSQPTDPTPPAEGAPAG